MIALISQDAIFGALVTIGLLLLSGIATIVYRSFANATGIQDIQRQLRECDIAKMRSQVDELWLDRRETWQYLKERGELEAVNSGMVRRNSPSTIEGTQDEEFKYKLYAPFLAQLLAIDAEVSHPRDESYLFEAIAKRLGGVFLRDICPIIKVNQGGCIELAIAVLRKAKALDVIPLPAIA